MLHAVVGAATVGEEFADAPDVGGGRDDAEAHPGFADGSDPGELGEVGGAVQEGNRAVAGFDLVFDLGGGDDEFDVELAFQSFADDVHVQDAQEAGAEAEAEGQ